MSPEEGQEELEEAQADIKKKEEEVCITSSDKLTFVLGYPKLHPQFLCPRIISSIYAVIFCVLWESDFNFRFKQII